MARAFAALAVCTVVVGCSGCGDVTVPGGEDIDGGLKRARSSSIPLYFVGRQFAGLPLTHVESGGDGRALFIYGTCVIPPEQTEGGCAPPLQIQVFPFKRGAWRRAVGCHRRSPVMGVPTVRFDGLVLFTRQTVIKIYGRSGRRVARALRDVRQPERILRRLPPPAGAVERLQRRVCT
jgi:hypothetical protein